MKQFNAILLTLFLIGFLIGCQEKSGVFLIGENTHTKVLTSEDAYCGGSQGQISTSGEYTIQSYLNGDLISEIELGTLKLVSGKAHDGLHLLSFQLDGKDVYKLAQYETCNSESVRLFRVDRDGEIQKVFFIKGGDESEEVSTDYEGTINMEEGRLSFCPYDNLSGKVMCDRYEYNQGRLEYLETVEIELANW